MNQHKVLTRAALPVLLAAAALAKGAYPQQPATGAGSSPSQSQRPAQAQQPPDTSATPPNKVVLKVGDEQVTADDLNFVLRSLNEQDQKALEGQGRRPLGEQYAMTLLLARQAAQDHLDATPSFRRQQAWERAQRLAQAEYEKMAQGIKINPDE